MTRVALPVSCFLLTTHRAGPSIAGMARSYKFCASERCATLIRSRATLEHGILNAMLTFLLWLLLLVVCWPLALLAIVLYPLVWLILLPFRLLGMAVGGVLELLRSIVMLPARLLRGPSHTPGR